MTLASPVFLTRYETDDTKADESESIRSRSLRHLLISQPFMKGRSLFLVPPRLISYDLGSTSRLNTGDLFANLEPP